MRAIQTYCTRQQTSPHRKHAEPSALHGCGANLWGIEGQLLVLSGGVAVANASARAVVTAVVMVEALPDVKGALSGPWRGRRGAVGRSL